MGLVAKLSVYGALPGGLLPTFVPLRLQPSDLPTFDGTLLPQSGAALAGCLRQSTACLPRHLVHPSPPSTHAASAALPPLKYPLAYYPALWDISHKRTPLKCLPLFPSLPLETAWSLLRSLIVSHSADVKDLQIALNGVHFTPPLPLPSVTFSLSYFPTFNFSIFHLPTSPPHHQP